MPRSPGKHNEDFRLLSGPTNEPLLSNVPLTRVDEGQPEYDDGVVRQPLGRGTRRGPPRVEDGSVRVRPHPRVQHDVQGRLRGHHVETHQLGRVRRATRTEKVV